MEKNSIKIEVLFHWYFVPILIINEQYSMRFSALSDCKHLLILIMFCLLHPSTAHTTNYDAFYAVISSYYTTQLLNKIVGVFVHISMNSTSYAFKFQSRSKFIKTITLCVTHTVCQYTMFYSITLVNAKQRESHNIYPRGICILSYVIRRGHDFI